MEKEPFLERMFKEFEDLNNKRNKLNEALKTEGFEEKVGTEEFALLKEQEEYMFKYERILLKRLQKHGMLNAGA